MSDLAFLDLLDPVALARHPHRRAACEAFRATGFPSRRDEAWHFTDLHARMRDFDWTASALAPDHQPSSSLPNLDLPIVVLRNGLWDTQASNPALFMTESAPDQAAGASPLPLVSLNTAFGQTGVDITLAEGEQGGTVMLRAESSASATPIAPCYQVTLGANASLTLIEIANGTGAYLHNPVWHIALGPGATLHHYRLQNESLHAVHTATLFIAMDQSAHYDGFTLAMGASLARSEFHLGLNGAQGSAHLNAAQLLTGRQHGDITTIIRHQAPHCASRQTVKSVLDGSARGVFQGRIEVDRMAQKTDGYQMNQALLLSPDAEIDSKPELEIFADDVKCSHGATIGALDPEQIFYLRSRGIAEPDARALLIRAFLTEALEPIGESIARPIFDAAIEAWWQRGAS